MNEALALSRGFEVQTLAETLKGVGEQFAFLRAPSKKVAKQLPSTSEETIKNISAVLKRILIGAIEKRTAADFVAYRQAELGNYFRAMRAMSDYARLVIPQAVLRQLATTSLQELEAELTASGGDAFGSVVRDQAIFTVWTFKKIIVLTEKMAEKIGDVPEDQKKNDVEFASNLVVAVIWARFHLDCLLTSLHSQRPIYPDVRDPIMDGLRAAVNAYAFAKQCVDLRMGPPEEPVMSIEWDAEDRELLDSSMRDMELEKLE